MNLSFDEYSTPELGLESVSRTRPFSERRAEARKKLGMRELARQWRLGKIEFHPLDATPDEIDAAASSVNIRRGTVAAIAAIAAVAGIGIIRGDSSSESPATVFNTCAQAIAEESAHFVTPGALEAMIASDCAYPGDETGEATYAAAQDFVDELVAIQP